MSKNELNKIEENLKSETDEVLKRYIKHALIDTPTLTKAKICKLIVEKIGLNKKEVDDFIEGFFEEIAKSLEQGNNVKLSSFGCFNLRDKNARDGRNPKTREEVKISARRVVTFHASPILKNAVQGH